MQKLDTIFLEKDDIFFDGQDPDTGAPCPIGTLEVTQLWLHPDLPCFFTINPMKHGIKRSADKVTRFQNWLFEFDKVDLDTQLKAIYSLSETLPIAMVTYSGSKSYHVIVSLQDTCPLDPGTEIGHMQYKAIWKALARYIQATVGLEPDPSTKNPNRLSRTPGALRPNTGKVQASVEHWKPRYITFENLMTTIKPFFQHTQAAPRVVGEVRTMREFTTALGRHELAELRNKLCFPRQWAAAENMYPELFRYALWAIDATGVDLETLLQYLSLHTFPIIKALGYPRDLEYPVRKAYEWKKFV